jgi:DNA polymerase III sliding clamp (beta) subunit (PCNA family)
MNINTKLLKAVVKSASDDQSRESINNVMIKIENGKIKLVATDGKQLIELSKNCENGETKELFIHRKVIKQIPSDMDIQIRTKSLTIKDGTYKAIYKASKDVYYPNCESSFPTGEPKASVCLSVKLLRDFLNSILGITEAIKIEIFENNKAIKITTGKRKRLSGSSRPIDSFDEQLNLRALIMPLKHSNMELKEAFEMLNHKIERVLDQYIKILNHHKTLTTKEVASFDIHLKMMRIEMYLVKKAVKEYFKKHNKRINIVSRLGYSPQNGSLVVK